MPVWFLSVSHKAMPNAIGKAAIHACSQKTDAATPVASPIATGSAGMYDSGARKSVYGGQYHEQARYANHNPQSHSKKQGFNAYGADG